MVVRCTVYVARTQRPPNKHKLWSTGRQSDIFWGLTLVDITVNVHNTGITLFLSNQGAVGVLGLPNNMIVKVSETNPSSDSQHHELNRSGVSTFFRVLKYLCFLGCAIGLALVVKEQFFRFDKSLQKFIDRFPRNEDHAAIIYSTVCIWYNWCFPLGIDTSFFSFFIIRYIKKATSVSVTWEDEPLYLVRIFICFCTRT